MAEPTQLPTDQSTDQTTAPVNPTTEPSSDAAQPSQTKVSANAADASSAQAPGVGPEPNTSGKPRILLAEDEEDARLIYLDILNTGEFEVEAAENGQKTLGHLTKKVYDLLLLDIIMPDMDGITVLAEIKKYPAKYGATKIVMLTNIGGDLAIEKALDMGANGYMLKSETEPEELLRIIRKYLAGQDHVKPEKTLLDS